MTSEVELIDRDMLTLSNGLIPKRNEIVERVVQGMLGGMPDSDLLDVDDFTVISIIDAVKNKRIGILKPIRKPRDNIYDIKEHVIIHKGNNNKFKLPDKLYKEFTEVGHTCFLHDVFKDTRPDDENRGVFIVSAYHVPWWFCPRCIKEELLSILGVEEFTEGVDDGEYMHLLNVRGGIISQLQNKEVSISRLYEYLGIEIDEEDMNLRSKYFTTIVWMMTESRYRELIDLYMLYKYIEEVHTVIGRL